MRAQHGDDWPCTQFRPPTWMCHLEHPGGVDAKAPLFDTGNKWIGHIEEFHKDYDPSETEIMLEYNIFYFDREAGVCPFCCYSLGDDAKPKNSAACALEDETTVPVSSNPEGSKGKARESRDAPFRPSPTQMADHIAGHLDNLAMIMVRVLSVSGMRDGSKSGESEALSETYTCTVGDDGPEYQDWESSEDEADEATGDKTNQPSKDGVDSEHPVLETSDPSMKSQESPLNAACAMTGGDDTEDWPMVSSDGGDSDQDTSSIRQIGTRVGHGKGWTVLLGRRTTLIALAAFLNIFDVKRSPPKVRAEIARLKQEIDSTHQNYAAMAEDLSETLSKRYVDTGTVGYLDEAIQLTRTAISASTSNFPYHTSKMLRRLGLKLHLRYECTNSMADLDESIELLRLAIADTPTCHPDRSAMLETLGDRYYDRHLRTESLEDLKKAQQLYADNIPAFR